MVKRILMVVAVSTLVCLAGATREVQASCSDCATTCAAGCFADGGCFSYSSTDCSGGISTCYYQCQDGEHAWADCSCGGGSPIFRKRPTQPAPTAKSSIRPGKPVPAAKPAEPAEPQKPVTEQAAKPVPSVKTDPHAKPEKATPTGSAQSD
jgi:hypothetical protein